MQPSKYSQHFVCIHENWIMSIHIWIHLSIQGKSWGEVPLVHWVGQLNVITKPVSVAISWGFFCHSVFYWTQRHFDSFLLPTFLTRIHFVCGTKRRAECLHPQKACDICERTLQCGQAELKTADWHATRELHVVTNTQACGGATPHFWPLFTSDGSLVLRGALLLLAVQWKGCEDDDDDEEYGDEDDDALERKIIARIVFKCPLNFFLLCYTAAHCCHPRKIISIRL